MFTLLPQTEIKAILEEHQKDPGARYAQRNLATELTDLVHGLGAGYRSQVMSSLIFAGTERVNVSVDEILDIFRRENMLKTIRREELVDRPWRDVVALLTGKSKCMYTSA